MSETTPQEKRNEKFKMEDFGEYFRQNNPETKSRAYIWAAAIGLQATDGLRTSNVLRQTARQHIEHLITMEEAKQYIRKYYEDNPATTPEKNKEQEADKVACNIAEILFSEQEVDFSTDGYMNLHRQIFDGVYEHAGKLRTCDLFKKEWVLEKETVVYLHWEEIRIALDSNFDFKENINYQKRRGRELVEWISHFTAAIWHIHPFNEGNTRTTAVLTILIMRSLGYDLNTDVFADHSWYYRNALVRANYMDLDRNIHVHPEYLIRFYSNWILGERWDLRNRYLLLHPTLNWLSQPNLAD